MNLELHKLERPLIKCQSDLQDELIDCIWSNLRLDLELNYALKTQRLKFMYEDDEYWGDYLRFVPVKTSKKKNLQKMIIILLTIYVEYRPSLSIDSTKHLN